MAGALSSFEEPLRYGYFWNQGVKLHHIGGCHFDSGLVTSLGPPLVFMSACVCDGGAMRLCCQCPVFSRMEACPQLPFARMVISRVFIRCLFVLSFPWQERRENAECGAKIIRRTYVCVRCLARVSVSTFKYSYIYFNLNWGELECEFLHHPFFEPFIFRYNPFLCAKASVLSASLFSFSLHFFFSFFSGERCVGRPVGLLVPFLTVTAKAVGWDHWRRKILLCRQVAEQAPGREEKRSEDFFLKKTELNSFLAYASKNTCVT